MSTEHYVPVAMAASLGLEKRQYTIVALDYVKAIQAVHERKKFEFVETLIGFVHSTMCYFRLGNAIHNDYRGFMQDLKLRVQNARENYNSFCTEADALVTKMLRTSFSGTASAAASSIGSSNINNNHSSNMLKLPPNIGRRASTKRRSNITLRPPVSQYLMLTAGTSSSSSPSNVPSLLSANQNSSPYLPKIVSNNNDFAMKPYQNNNNLPPSIRRPSFADIYGYRFCEGYLLLLDRRKKTRLHANSQQWCKYYCRYDAATGELMLRAHQGNNSLNNNNNVNNNTLGTAAGAKALFQINTNSAPFVGAMSIDVDPEAKILHVQQCCIHDPDTNHNNQNAIERRFCFDVYATESFTTGLNAKTSVTDGVVNGPHVDNGSIRSNRSADDTVAAAKGQTNMRILTFQATSNEDRNIWVRTMAESSQHATSTHLSAAQLMPLGGGGSAKLSGKRNSVDAKNAADKHKSSSTSSASPQSILSSTSSKQKQLEKPAGNKSLFGIANNSFSDSEEAVENNNNNDNEEEEDDDDIIDESGIKFIAKCIDAIEKRGLREQGLYRTAGVASRVNKLLHEYYSLGPNSLNLLHEDQWEVKTITSALKTFLRSLREPLMTLHLHAKFIAAAKSSMEKNDTSLYEARVARIDRLVQDELPPTNRQLLAVVIGHLSHVVEFSQFNLMTAANLATCFGPTLMRPLGDTVAELVDIKFANVVVECLIDNFQLIFNKNRRQQEQHQQNAAALVSPSRGESSSSHFGTPLQQEQFFYYGDDGTSMQKHAQNVSAVDFSSLSLASSKTRRLKQQQQQDQDNLYGFENVASEQSKQQQQRISQSSLVSPDSKDFVLDDGKMFFDDNYDNIANDQSNDDELTTNRPPSRLKRARNIRYPRVVRDQPAKTVQLPLPPHLQQQQIFASTSCSRAPPDLLLSTQQQAVRMLPNCSTPKNQSYTNSTHQQQQYGVVFAPLANNNVLDAEYAQQPYSRHNFRTNGGFTQYTLPTVSGSAAPRQHHQNTFTPPSKMSHAYSIRFDSLGAASSSYQSLVATPAQQLQAAEARHHARFASLQQNGLPNSTLYYQYDDADCNGQPRVVTTAIPKYFHQKHKSMPDALTATTPTNNNNNNRHALHAIRTTQTQPKHQQNIDDVTSAHNRLRLFSERRGSDSPSQAEAQRRRWTTLILHPFNHDDLLSPYRLTTPSNNNNNLDDDLHQTQHRLTPTTDMAGVGVTPRRTSDNNFIAHNRAPDDDANQYFCADNVFASAPPTDDNILPKTNPVAFDKQNETEKDLRRRSSDQSFTLNNRKSPRKKSPHHYYLGRHSMVAAGVDDVGILSPLQQPQQLPRRRYGGSTGPALPFTLRKNPISTIYNFTSGGVGIQHQSVIDRRRKPLSSAISSPSLINLQYGSVKHLEKKGIPENYDDNFHIKNSQEEDDATNRVTPSNNNNNNINGLAATEEKVVSQVQLKTYTQNNTDNEEEEDSANADDERRDSLSPPQVALQRHHRHHRHGGASSVSPRQNSVSGGSVATTSSLSNTLSSSTSSVGSFYDNNNKIIIDRTRRGVASSMVVENNNSNNVLPAKRHHIQEFQLNDI